MSNYIGNGTPGHGNGSNNTNLINALREPQIDSQTVCLSGGGGTFTFNQADGLIVPGGLRDQSTTYYILRSTTGVFTPPIDGKDYAIGASFGTGTTLIAKVAHLGAPKSQATFIDPNPVLNAVYRVYACRFSGLANGNYTDNGAAYNTTQFVKAGGQTIASLQAKTDTNVCVPGTFTFSYAAKVFPKGWKWSYPKGVTRQTGDSITAAGVTTIKLTLDSTAVSGSVKITSTGACADSSRLRIHVNRQPVSSPISGPTVLCRGNAGTYRIHPKAYERKALFTWTTTKGSALGSATDSSLTLVPSAGNDSTLLIVTKTLGLCTYSDSLKVYFGGSTDLPELVAVDTNAFCTPGTYSFQFIKQVLEPNVYWQYPAGVSRRDSTNKLGATTITLNVDAGASPDSMRLIRGGICPTRVSVFIPSATPPALPLIKGALKYCTGKPATLHFSPAPAEKGATYTWSLSAGSIISGGTDTLVTIQPLSAEHITATVTKTVGPCTVISQAQLTFTDSLCPDVTYNNVITPFGNNQKMEVLNLPNSGHADLEVYNRWGKLVYEKAPYLNDWSGDDLPAGTYYYILNYTDLKGSHSENGVFQIIK